MACVKIRSIKKQHIQKRELNIRVKRQSHGSDMNMQTNRPGTMERQYNDGKKILYEREKLLNTKSMK